MFNITQDTLKSMANGKAMEPGGIPVELWKSLGEDG